MIKTLDLNRKTTAILENVYNISYEKQVNSIHLASFSLPLNDTKNEMVKLLQYVEIPEVGLCRIIPKNTVKNESDQSVRYECEHVLATLLDSILFQYHQLSNWETREVLEYILSQQKEQHWVLGNVEFSRYFHYSWENENVLNALFSVPRPFDEQTRWEWNTESYPWTLNLIHPEVTPTCRIKERHNLKGMTIEENPMSVYNRVYPLGAGDGVNKLTISSVNNGVPYIEDAESIVKYGLKETTWADPKFENAATLKASAEALLKKWKEPIVTWQVSAADVSEITGASIDELKEGKVVRIDVDDFPVTDLRIMKEAKADAKGNPGDIQLDIGSVQEDLGTTQKEMERRQQVNELYSVGATNILNADRNDNIDPTHPMKFLVRIPEHAVKVNYMELTWESGYFRGYTKGAKSAGQFTQEAVVQSKSTEDGGYHVESSVVQSKSTEAGGYYQKPTESKTTEIHNAVDVALTSPPMQIGGVTPDYLDHWHGIDPQWFKHDHLFTIPGFTIVAHKHNFEVTWPGFTLQPHKHNFEVIIPALEIPGHEHEQIYGIYEHDKMPSALEIKVDGTVIPHSELQGESVELKYYLAKDSNGDVQTGRYATIEIRPLDELVNINATVIWGLFIRSHKEVTV